MIFYTIKLDLETQRQMTIQAIQEKIDEGKMTDTEEDFWDEVVTHVEALTEDDVKVENGTHKWEITYENEGEEDEKEVRTLVKKKK